MDDETRAAFGRIDRWFELNQAQYSELRQDVAGLHMKFDDLRQGVGSLRREIDALRQEIDALRQEIDALRQEIDALRQEFYRFRDWVTAQFAEIRLALQQLTLRVERLEYRKSDSIG
jgi:uncharacterized coiled-coil DUF342 family protein